MSHIHPRGGLLCIINVCRQQGLHRRHCRNQQLHINTQPNTHRRTHWLSSLLPAAVMRVSSYTLMLTQCFPATLHMVTLCTEWVKTRRRTALAGSCSLTEQETQPFAVTIVLVSDNWGGGGYSLYQSGHRKCSFVSPVCPPPEADVWASVSIDTSQLQGSIRKMSVGTPAPREVFSEKCL